MPKKTDITLVYDRECPVCDFYSRRIEVSEGDLVRVNAREGGANLDEITAAGLDIDAGMAVKVGDTLYFGSDAIHKLALLSSGEGFFNKGIAIVFRSQRVAKTLYPALVGCRNLLLKFLGRSRINNLGKTDRASF